MLARNPSPELTRMPWGGTVHTASPDGYYWKRTSDEVQVIVVGPMCCAPIEIAHAVNRMLCPDGGARQFHVKDINFMTCADPEMNQVTIERGFVSVLLERSK